MNYKQGISRQQISMCSLDSLIAADSCVRLIDLFVEQLDVEKLGFCKTQLKKEGCPPYHPKDMLKLYYYGYLNRIRSSRKLEAECCRNVELWWLLRRLCPAYHTIANFRSENAAAFKEAFKVFVSFLKGEDLLAGETIAIDGTKIRAQNNRKNNYNEDKLTKHLAYIENKTQQYITELNEADAGEGQQAAELKKQELARKLEVLQKRKKKYENLQVQLQGSGEAQISTVDPDSRALSVKGDATNVCYNLQTAADSRHSLLVSFDTVNEGDQRQLSRMATAAQEALGVKQLTVMADTGYHVGKELQRCAQQSVITLVAYPKVRDRSQQINPAYQTSNFSYDKKADCYRCPEGQLLTTTGSPQQKNLSSERRT